MSDTLMPNPMTKMPPGPNGPPPIQPGGNVEKNLSIFNPKDFVLMVKTMANDPKATVRDLLGRLGIDADGPVTQITDFLTKSKENATPLGQMQNIAAGKAPDTELSPGGQPPTMPGRKPMVSPPGAPTAGGIEGLLGKLGR